MSVPHVLDLVTLVQLVGAVVAVIGRRLDRPCYVHIWYLIVSALIHLLVVVIVLL